MTAWMTAWMTALCRKPSIARPLEPATRAEAKAERRGNRPRWVWRLVVVGAVSAMALVYFGVTIDLEEILGLLASVEFHWVVAALSTFLAGHVLRCLRYKVIWRWRISKETLGITATHGFTTYMLPLRLGELALPLLLRRGGHASFGHALAGLIMIRIFDALLVAILGLTLFLVSPQALLTLLPPGAQWLEKILIPGYTLSLLAAVFLLSLIPGIISIKDKVDFLLASFGIWASVLGMNYFTLLALGLQPGVEVLVMLIVLGMFVTVLPLQGVAGLGGHELVWVTSLTAGGLAAKAGLDYAIASHLLMAGYACVLGGLGLMLLAHPRAALKKH